MSINLPYAKLPELLLDLSKQGHKFAYLELKTAPHITKKDRTTKSLSISDVLEHPKDLSIVAISKETKGVYSLNADYESIVNSRLKKNDYEQNFEAGSLPFGEWVPGSKLLITHKGEYYIRLYPYEGENKSINEISEVTYFKVYSNGIEEELDSDEFDKIKYDFLPLEKTIKPLTEGSFDEVKPIVISPKLISVTLIKVNGIEYRIK